MDDVNSKSTAKRHHFVPQGLLKNFSPDHSGRIFFARKDLQEINSSMTQTINLAQTRKLYVNPESQESMEESFFSSIDSLGISVIRKIIKKQTAMYLEDSERDALNTFVAAQICRTPAMENKINNFVDLFRSIYGKAVITITKNKVREAFLYQIKENTKAYKSFLTEKTLTVFSLSNRGEFIIGDNPVVISTGSTVIMNPRVAAISAINGNIFALPINPKTALIFYEEKSHPNMKYIIEYLNVFQIQRAINNFYGNNKNILALSIKKYNEYHYDLVSRANPELLVGLQINRGEQILFGEKIIFEGASIDEIRKTTKDDPNELLLSMLFDPLWLERVL